MTKTLIDDFEDGNVSIDNPNWDGWNDTRGDLDPDVSPIAISGSYSGQQSASSDIQRVEATRNEPEWSDIELSLKIRSTDQSDFGTYDGIQITIGSTVLEYSADGVYVDGGQVLSSWSEGTVYDIRFELNRSNGDVTVYQNGTELGTNNGAAANGIDTIDIQLNTSDAGFLATVQWDDVYEDILKPATPQNAGQSVEGDDEINVTWDEDTSEGDPDSYDIEVSEDGGSYAEIGTTSSTSITHQADPETNTHQYRVRASNAGGSSSWVHTETVATDPTNLSPTGTAQREITLAWGQPRDATGYEVFRAESGGIDPQNDSPIDTTDTPPYTDTGLEDGEKYFYSVRATYPGTPSQPSNEVNATTPLPAPTIDGLDATTLREITIEYALSDNSMDGDVLVERSADGGATWGEVAIVEDISATELVDDGLFDGQEYTYRLTRRTDHVEADSPMATAVTVLPAPIDLTRASIGDTSAGYAWDATHNQGGTRVEYRRAGDGDDWITHQTVDNETEEATVDGLLTGEQYEGRVVAQTSYAEAEDE